MPGSGWLNGTAGGSLAPHLDLLELAGPLHLSHNWKPFVYVVRAVSPHTEKLTPRCCASFFNDGRQRMLSLFLLVQRGYPSVPPHSSCEVLWSRDAPLELFHIKKWEQAFICLYHPSLDVGTTPRKEDVTLRRGCPYSQRQFLERHLVRTCWSSTLLKLGDDSPGPDKRRGL